MAVRIGDTLKQINNADFPIVEAMDVAFESGDTLQELYDSGALSNGGSGTSYVELSEEEYFALSDEQRTSEVEYRTYDTGRIFKRGVEYGKDGVQISDNETVENKTWSSQKTSSKIAEKVDKTDISTTIDSTSTDDTVPSTKAVYDATSNFRKTYTSIKQLGLTIGSETIEDIANSMEDQTRLIALIFETEHNVSIYPYRNGTLLVEKINIYRVNLKFFEDISNNVYVSTYHGAKGFTGWKRLCATSVADVPKTLITSEDADINLSINCSYLVVNGICYVSLWSFTANTTGQHIICSSMPKTKATSQGMCSYGQSGGIGACAFIFDDGSDKSKLYIEVNIVNETLYGTFSYPVAE